MRCAVGRAQPEATTELIRLQFPSRHVLAELAYLCARDARALQCRAFFLFARNNDTYLANVDRSPRVNSELTARLRCSALTFPPKRGDQGDGFDAPHDCGRRVQVPAEIRRVRRRRRRPGTLDPAHPLLRGTRHPAHGSAQAYTASQAGRSPLGIRSPKPSSNCCSAWAGTR